MSNTGIYFQPSSYIGTVTGDSGGALVPVANNIIIAGGSGIVTSGAGNTLTITALDSEKWSEVTALSASLAAGYGYVANNAALVTLTLPTTAAFGTIIRVAGLGAGGVRIAQNANQQVLWNALSSTSVGPAGSLTSTDRYDSVDILCVVDNLTWSVINAKGNWTVV